MRKPYDYAARSGVRRIGWEEFGALSRRLTEAIAWHRPDLVVGIARGGLIPAAAIAAALRLDLTPIRLTRREQDRPVHAEPVWRVPLVEGVAGRRVVVVDDIADTGRTLELVARCAGENGAAEVTTAALVRHSWAEPPVGHVALVSDALVVFPWDAEVYAEGSWGPHPELAHAIRSQRELG